MRVHLKMTENPLNCLELYYGCEVSGRFVIRYSIAAGNLFGMQISSLIMIKNVIFDIIKT